MYVQFSGNDDMQRVCVVLWDWVLAVHQHARSVIMQQAAIDERAKVIEEAKNAADSNEPKKVHVYF